MRDRSDMDTSPEEEVQSGPEEFAAIVGHMLAERDAATVRRDRETDGKLDEIGQTLRDMLSAFTAAQKANRESIHDLRSDLTSIAANLELMRGEVRVSRSELQIAMDRMDRFEARLSRIEERVSG